jgi:hypothetical protein
MIQNIVKKIQSKESITLISIIFGLALASLFKKQCVDGKCYVIKATENPQNISKYYYRIGDDCYKYTPQIVSCPVNND